MTSPQLQRSEPTWRAIVRLLRWDKPTGRLILMVPALWAVFLAARGGPPWPLVGIIVVGSLVTSAAGCVVNDLWDRRIDAQVARTRQRPLAAQTLSVPVGVAVAMVAFLCAYGLALYLNPLSFWLCVLAVPVIVVYPAAKRVFPLPQLVLSLAWGFAVLIPWTAVTGRLEWPLALLWAATLLWTLGFDTVYAIPDREYDRRLGIHSSALLFGRYTPLMVGCCFLGTGLLLGSLGWVMGLGWPYWLTLAIAVLVWARHTFQLSQYAPPPQRYGQIFRQNVGLGFVLLLGMVVGMI